MSNISGYYIGSGCISGWYLIEGLLTFLNWFSQKFGFLVEALFCLMLYLILFTILFDVMWLQDWVYISDLLFLKQLVEILVYHFRVLLFINGYLQIVWFSILIGQMIYIGTRNILLCSEGNSCGLVLLWFN